MNKLISKDLFDCTLNTMGTGYLLITLIEALSMTLTNKDFGAISVLLMSVVLAIGISVLSILFNCRLNIIQSYYILCLIIIISVKVFLGYSFVGCVVNHSIHFMLCGCILALINKYIYEIY